MHMVAVPLFFGVHWHGGCPPALSQEKGDHYRQQGAQHSSHSISMETREEMPNKLLHIESGFTNIHKVKN